MVKPMRGAAEFDWRDGTLHLVLSGEIDYTVTDLLGDDVLAEYETTGGVVVDMTRVVFLDSLGLSLLLRLRNQSGGAVTLVGVAPEVRRLFDLTGLTSAFTFTPA